MELAVLGSGAIFGEMSYIDSSRTTARVRTVETTEVLELQKDYFDSILADTFDTIYDIVSPLKPVVDLLLLEIPLGGIAEPPIRPDSKPRSRR